MLAIHAIIFLNRRSTAGTLGLFFVIGITFFFAIAAFLGMPSHCLCCCCNIETLFF